MPDYDNSILTTTEVQVTYRVVSGAPYGELELLEGIPHDQQIEVFRSGLADEMAPITSGLTIQDRRNIGLIPNQYITFNEATKQITQITLPDPFEVNLEAGGTIDLQEDHPLQDGDVLIIRRRTVSNNKFVTWATDARLTPGQLNLSVDQLISLIQEMKWDLTYNCIKKTDKNAIDGPLFLNVDYDLDMDGNKFTNMGSGTPGTADSANMQDVQTAIEAHLNTLVGENDGICPLGSDGKIPPAYLPSSGAGLPATAFQQATMPVRSVSNLFGYGSLWLHTGLGGKLFIYMNDDAFTGAPSTGEIGYWVDISGANGNPSSAAHYGASAPVGPSAGALWYDTNTSTLKVYNGSSWVGN